MPLTSLSLFTSLLIPSLSLFSLSPHSPQVRASKLVGLRLEKHMDKLREQYIAQREEEEVKRQQYHSPKAARRHNGEGSGEESEGEEAEGEEVVGSVQPQWRQAMEHKSHSASPASHTPEHTPEPANTQAPPPVAPRPGLLPVAPRPGLPPMAPRPTPPPMAPRPSPPPTAPRPTKRSNGIQGTPPPPQPPAPYNPYPPPSQPAPPPR